MSSIFFNTFFNIEKYLEHEQRDPLSVARVRNVADYHLYQPSSCSLRVGAKANQQVSLSPPRIVKRRARTSLIGRGMLQRSMTFWWQRRRPMSSIMKGKASLSIGPFSGFLHL